MRTRALSTYTRLVLTGLALTVAVGCGGEEAPPIPPTIDGAAACGPSSCFGCCQAGKCVYPPTNSACGAGGLPCTACLTGQTCNISTGLCQGGGTCGTATCTGCCKSNQCLGGKANTACGSGGIFCVDCTLTSKTCNATTGKCQASTTCSSSSCSGCCKGNQCLGGKANSACGTGGAACVDCSATGGTCDTTTGKCKGGTTCTTSNCNGCCKGNQCLGGKTNAACGTGGVSCVDCSATGGTCNTTTGKCQGGTTCTTSNCNGCCQGNQCLSGTSTTACGTGGVSCVSCKTGETCTNQSCTSSTATSYKVTLVSAKLLVSAYTACLETNCDLYVELKVGNLTATSTIKADNNNPTWNEYLMTATTTNLTSSFTATVKDDDYGPDNTVGTCTPTVTASILASGKLVTKCSYTLVGDTVELTFTFQAGP